MHSSVLDHQYQHYILLYNVFSFTRSNKYSVKPNQTNLVNNIVPLQYYDKESISTRALEENICAVCGQSVSSAKTEKAEAVYKLSCGHTYPLIPQLLIVLRKLFYVTKHLSRDSLLNCVTNCIMLTHFSRNKRFYKLLLYD